jgi:hypothetical protein
MDWVTPVAFIVALALAMFVVPRMARRIERESYERDPTRTGWYHPHVDRDRKEPRPPKRAPREPESEEHSP